MISRGPVDNLRAMPRRKREAAERISFNVDPEFKAKVEKAAKKHQVDVAAYVKFALSERMRRDGFET